MRYVSIDLSSDNYLQQPHLFGGYAGEHNETILQVKLPDRMIGIEYSGYRFDFQTSEDNKISSPLIPISKLNNGVLSFHLTEQITVAGNLSFNVVATLSNGDTVSLTSKTNMTVLYIGDSPDGNSILPDPDGYKDEILEMIDARIAEINPVKSDQTYDPTSENAQSGKAVAEAINNIKFPEADLDNYATKKYVDDTVLNKMDKFGTVTEEDFGSFTVTHINFDNPIEIGSIDRCIRINPDGSMQIGSNSQGEISFIYGLSLSSPTGYIYHSNNILQAVGTPQAADDAATKGYVDNLVGDIETLLGGI